MNSSINSFLKSCYSHIIFCVFAMAALQGCGADRAETYNPQVNCSSSSLSSNSSISSSDSSNSSSSTSSSANSCASSSSRVSSSSVSSASSTSSDSSQAIEVTKLINGADTLNTSDQVERSVQAIRDQNSFDKIIDKYVDHNLIDPIDFDNGQVILVYDGEVNSCEQHLEFNSSLSAATRSDTSITVTLNYLEKPTQSNCSPSISHPFAFYYVQSRKLVVFDEEVVP